MPEQTRTATNFWVGVVECFCREKQVRIDLKACLAEELGDCLRNFHQGLKTKKGKTYQSSFYLWARLALQRHLSYLKRSLDLRSAFFKRSNEVLDAVLKWNKSQGAASLCGTRTFSQKSDWQVLHCFLLCSWKKQWKLLFLSQFKSIFLAFLFISLSEEFLPGLHVLFACWVTFCACLCVWGKGFGGF